MTQVSFVATTQKPVEVKQSRIRRDWMDETYKKHAYQCMPMTVANVLGWEFILEEDVVVQWDGGNTVPYILSGATTKSGRDQASCSIIGMISFNMTWVVRTENGYSTWYSGAPNYFHSDAEALSATVPSYWWADEVQMNWRLRTIGAPITFKAGEPFCFVQVYDNSVMESATVSIENLWDDKELIEQRMKYGELKSKNNTENPWTWTKGIKTGLDADGNQIGPTFMGLPVLSSPNFTETTVLGEV